ncbi:MAG: outer membrane lipoprotein carrier protein LolA [Candidatus Firestonebacteria bacterium]
MKIKIKIFSCVVVFFSLVSAGYSLTGDEAVGYFSAVFEEKVNTFKADVLQTVAVSDLEAPQKLKGRLVLKKPDKFSVEYIEPRQQVKCNGKNVWIYMEAENQVLVQDLKDLNAKDNILFGFNSFINKLKKNYINSIVSKDNSRDLVEVEALPREGETGLSKIRLVIDSLRWLPVGITVYYSETNYISVVFSNQTVNEKVRDEIFEFKTPEGAIIINTPIK